MNFRLKSWWSYPVILLFLFITASNVYAQQSLYIAQSKVFGGSSDDVGNAIALSVDSSEIYLGGASFSSDFYLSGNEGGADYWIMRSTLEGDTLWSKHFGGRNSDELNALLPQPDGSVFGFGTTYSDFAEFGELEGLFGAWLMRANSDGELISGKLFTSNISEKGIDIVQTNENLITVLGETASDELEGQMNHGITDFFVSRLTTAGITLWTRVFGGSSMDTPAAMKKTNDAGLIIAGSSMSNGGDVDTNRGGFDMWILKLLPSGDIEWSKTYGGSEDDFAHDVLPLSDGGFIIVGSTRSQDGDVTEEGVGESDLWLIQIDSEGELIWDKRYGGSQDDIGLGISLFQNNTFIVAGSTESQDNDLSGNKGRSDEWIIHFDANGNIINQMNYGGSETDIPGEITTTENEIFIIGSSDSDDGTLPFQLYPENNMWLLTMSNDSFVCSENFVCRQDTIISSNILSVETDSGITCINSCNVGLGTVPAFIQSTCPDVENESAIIMIYTDDNADFINLSVESAEFNKPYIVLTRSINCINYFPIECVTGANGIASIENIPVLPNTLYAAIISDAEGNVGEFEFCSSAINVEFCNQESDIYAISTSLGSPLQGPFLPGEEVTICYEITDWEKLDCNGLQGIVPTFGEGWDISNFNSFGEPVDIDTALQSIAGGFWDWYEVGAVNYNTLNPVNGYQGGQGMPAGWYFLNTDGPPPNSEPNETEGDIALCSPTDDAWKVCFTLKTVSECLEDLDCSITFKTFADGEIGVNNSLACGYDSEIEWDATLNCCINPRISSIPDITRCSGDTTAFTIATNILGEVNYSWTVVSADPGIFGATNGEGVTFSQVLVNGEVSDQVVTYQVNASSELCAADPIQFSIIVRPVPRTSMSLAGPSEVCSGEQIELQFTNEGIGPFVILVASSDNTIDTLLIEGQEGSVFITPDISTQYVAVGLSDQNCVGDAGGVVNVTVLPNPATNINALICEGEAFSIGELQFDSPGQYSATIPNGSTNGCDSTVFLTLSVAPNQSSDLDTFICRDEVLVLGSDTFKTSGIYPLIFENQFGCDSIINLNLTIGSETITEQSQTICSGSSVIFNGEEYSIQGTYADSTVLGDGCYFIDILNLTVLPQILVESLTINPDNGNGTGAILLDITGGTPPYSFLWDDGSTTGSVTDLTTGDYHVIITDVVGCTAEFMFSVPLGTPTAEQIKLIQKIQVYPNPVATGESLMVEFIADKQDLPLQVEIINIVGQSFEKRKLIPGGAIDLKTDAISPGLYFIRFQQENVTVVKKVIIQ